MNNKFYVYVYFRLDGSPCYVGKGCGKRWLYHELKGKCYNPLLAKIINRAGGSLPKVKIRENLTSADACRIEVAFIAAIGRGRNGPLVNMTDGGEGLGGIPMAEEIKSKISKANSGRRFTDEHRTNLSKSRKEMFAQRRAAGIETRLSPEHRAAIGAGNAGKVISSEARAKMSIAKKGKTPPGAAERMGIYSRNKTPAHRAKLAAMCRERNTRGIKLGDFAAALSFGA